MDAPTTTSADNGTSGGSGGGGWFKPHKQPETPPGGEQEATEGSRLAALRPVGRPATGGATSSSPDGSDRPSATEPPPDQARIPASAPPELPAPPPIPAPLPLAPASPLPAPFAPAPTANETPVRPPSAPEAQAFVAPPSAASPDAVAPAPPAPLSDPPVPVQRLAPATGPLQGASPDAVLIQRTMEVVGPVADKATSYFYALLFVRHPELRSLFPAAMDTQRDRLLKALLTAAEHIDNTEVLVAYLQSLGRGHPK